MTALLEKLIALIAPHTCIVCSTEDNTVCAACAQDVFAEPLSACVFCGAPTVDWRLCKKCHATNPLIAVWVVAEYEEVVVEIMKRFKFARAKAFYLPLAQALEARLPYLEPDTLVVPLPTATGRVRQRGYDQTLLLAQELARIRGLQLVRPLVRTHNARQVGAKREQRQEQAKTAYQLSDATHIKGRSVLLVDDICTTGASLVAAARLLRSAGAASVSGAVVAWQPFKK